MLKIYAIAPSHIPEYIALEKKVQDTMLDMKAKQDFEASEGMAVAGGKQHRDDRPYQVVDGLALYSIDGMIMAKSNWVTRWLGIASYEDIASSFAMMYQDDEVEKVLISASGPGGLVSGLSDVSDTWTRLNGKKPITVHTSGNIASAYMWLTCHSTKIYASETANVGSIGVKLEHESYQKMQEEMGIKSTEVKSAPLKAIGSPARDLTDAELAHLQEKIDESGDIFKKTIYRNLPNVSQEVFTGEMFSASKALKYGLIDGIMTYSEVYETLSADSQQHNNSFGGDDMRRKVSETMAAALIEGGASPESLEILSQEAYDALPDDQKIIDEGASEANESEKGSEVSEPTLEEVQASLSASEEKVVELEASIATLQEGIATAETARDEALAQMADTEGIDELKAVVCTEINRKRVGLGFQKLDLEGAKAADIVSANQYASDMTTKNFKSGGHVNPSSRTPEPQKQDSQTAATFKAVGI